MTTPPQPSAASPHPPADGLAATLVTLAGTPDDATDVDGHLMTIARLVPDVVEPVSYASISAYRAGAPTTVAASSQVALAVDLAQYGDGAGPCLDALAGAKPVGVPDVAAVMSWPGFRDLAWRLGLRSSLSIPLVAGSGSPVAALNLYAHEPAPMIALARRVWELYDTGALSEDEQPPAGEGTVELLAGLAGALRVRVVIQRAMGVIMTHHHLTADKAYIVLRTRAAEAGGDLVDTATSVLHGRV